jgi:putative sterol carrier protein
MMMVHPNFQPATLGTSEDARKGTPATFGTAMKFPPVTVQNEQQREYHEAQGYVPGGKSNPAAFVQAHAAPDPMRHHGHQEFPKFVGEILVKNEDEERAAIEKNAKELSRARAEARRLAEIDANKPADTNVQMEAMAKNMAAMQAVVAGLTKSVGDLAFAMASAPPPMIAPEKLPTSVDALFQSYEERALAAGVKVDRRWSLEKLISATAEAEAAERKSAAAVDPLNLEF